MPHCRVDVSTPVAADHQQNPRPLWMVLAAILLTACASPDELPDLRPQVDLSPVGCGYKWFQSGYSPGIRVACAEDRSALRDAHTALAREHAWQVAARRCPIECPPVELEDSVETPDAFPDGVCRSGHAYFTARVFFRCGAP